MPSMDTLLDTYPRVRFFYDAHYIELHDSMLLDPDTIVASLKLNEHDGDASVRAFIRVEGEVDVEFNGEHYTTPSNFPDELVELIRQTNGACLYDDTPNVRSVMDNWFEIHVEESGVECAVAKTLTEIPERVDEVRGILEHALEEAVDEKPLRTFNFTNRFGTTYTIAFEKAAYTHGDSLAIEVYDLDDDGYYWEPYATLTRNLDEPLFYPDCAYVDSNNVPDLVDFVIDKGWATVVDGAESESGFCTYPCVRFSGEFLEKICR